MSTYIVRDLKCPVIVRAGCAIHLYPDHRPGIWHESENRCEESFAGRDGACHEEYGRCDQNVVVMLAISESGRGYYAVSCLEGHEVAAMAHDNALDLDGVPLNA